LVVEPCGVVGWDGVTPATGTVRSSGLTIGFAPVSPPGESGCSTATSVELELRLCSRLPALATTGAVVVETRVGAVVSAAGRLAATAAARADAA
jgi:hypothetical protein